VPEPPFMTDPRASTAGVRQPWYDRWLLDAFRQLGHPLDKQLPAATTAWEGLEAIGFTTEQIARVVCDVAGVKRADVSALGPPDAKLLSQSLATRYDVVAVRLDGRTLEVATGNPLGNNLERDLAFACAKQIRVVVAAPHAIRAARERVYGTGDASAPAAPAPNAPRLTWIVQQNPHTPSTAPTRGIAVDMLDRVIIDAVDQRASDIHLEPQDGELLVRYRVDGVLHDVTRITADITPLLLSRLKVSAGLDIANRLRPQDGRASMILDGRHIDLRISTLPLGERIEKAVVRILDASATTLDFVALGFSQQEQQVLSTLLHGSEGMVLVTGPTGSGKTTSLYAALRHVKSRETNIVTVEDPIEYRLGGINQVQVNEKSGLTFAAALRSILRQDPDVVLVGEVRDVETAGIAIRASMTGHLVLSTLHTNDATSAISRLADMGVDLSALAGALKAVIAQRLVRRLCTECSVPVSFEDLPVEQQVLMETRDTSLLRRPVGCAACRGTGYRGRMVVAEMLVIDDETQQLMSRTSQRMEFVQLARKHGMHTLWETGLDRVLQGLTSISELIANVTPPIPEADLHQEDVDRLLADLMGGTPAPANPAPTAEAATTVSVPARAPAEDRPVVSMPVRAPVSRLPIAPRSPNQRGPRVLVVHEGRERRRQLRESLQNAGCVVIETADGESALAYACRLRPDAVITELAVPKLDGLGLLQTLLAEDVVDRVFVYTEQRDERLLDWARDLGATDVLTTEDDVVTVATRVRSEFPDHQWIRLTGSA
jgi:type II secretory ATPase GspE/PulE/Tfp pilus assembly ATPase PilB-like protein/CheY-like chemotaxis protein